MEQMFVRPLVRDLSPPRRSPRVRRRSRTRLALFGMVLALAGLLLLGGVVAGGASTGPQRVTVHAGDTLWGIAESHHPGGDVQEEVAELEALNHLNSAAISPGEILILPAA